MTVKIGFTGGRHLNEPLIYGRLYMQVKRNLPPSFSKFITGGAEGADSIIGQWLVEEMPLGMFHKIIVPHNRSQVDSWWTYNDRALELKDLGYLEVQYMPEGTTYKDRNQEIVNQSNWVLGFPAYDERDPRSLRSGTWQTIRMARKADKLLAFYTSFKE
jgi:hypothetical protein